MALDYYEVAFISTWRKVLAPVIGKLVKPVCTLGRIKVLVF